MYNGNTIAAVKLRIALLWNEPCTIKEEVLMSTKFTFQVQFDNYNICCVFTNILWLWQVQCTCISVGVAYIMLIISCRMNSWETWWNVMFKGMVHVTLSLRAAMIQWDKRCRVEEQILIELPSLSLLCKNKNVFQW